MKKLLLILTIPFVSCITITKNYYPANTVVECKHTELKPIYNPPYNNPFITPSYTAWPAQGTATISGTLLNKSFCMGCLHKNSVCAVYHNGTPCDWNTHTCGIKN